MAGKPREGRERALTNSEKQAAHRARIQAELVRLRAFVQWVADHTREAATLRQAIAHGATVKPPPAHPHELAAVAPAARD